jgi:hypothetical protein
MWLLRTSWLEFLDCALFHLTGLASTTPIDSRATDCCSGSERTLGRFSTTWE